MSTAGDCLDFYWSVVLAHLSQMLIGDSVLSESGAMDLLNLGKKQENIKIRKTWFGKNKTYRIKLL